MFENTLAYDKTSNFCFFDLETFNLELSFLRNRPWQATFINRVNNSNISVHDLFVKWDTKLKIGAGAAAVTHYNEDLFQVKAISDKDAWPTVYSSLEEADYLVGHNILSFDMYLIKEWYKMNGKDYRHLIPKCIDTKCLSLAYKLGIKKPQGVNLFEFQLPYINLKQKGLKSRLEVMGKEFGIEHDYANLHDALVDLGLNIKVWDKLKFALDI